MLRSSAIVFIVITVFGAAGFALQTMRASDEAALFDEIATHVELNRIQLKRLQGELDQLQQQLSFVTRSLHIHYEYFDMRCTLGDGRMRDSCALQERMTWQETAWPRSTGFI